VNDFERVAPTHSRPRGASFGTAAATYDRLRPSPPPEALDWLLTGNERRVLDLGAGTGQVTRRLLERELDVVAVEPDERMRELLAVRCPGATAVAGAAEAIPLPAADVDAVLVGAAWHWFDAAAATAEIARVLRPGGRLGVLFTVLDVYVEWVRELSGIETLDPDASEPGRAYSRIELGASFGPIQETTIRGERTMPTSDVVELFSTQSDYLTADEPARAAIRERVRRGLQGRGEPVTLPVMTACWRATRVETAQAGRA
jgi:SAM-dependent methyltransferase